MLEVWCDVPAAPARRRYERRLPRHPVHGAPATDGEREHWGLTAEPIGLGPVPCVDPSGPIRVEDVSAWLARRW